jgi:hypothetical protein
MRSNSEGIARTSGTAGGLDFDLSARHLRELVEHAVDVLVAVGAAILLGQLTASLMATL